MSLRKAAIAISAAAITSSAYALETRFVSFKAYEEFPIKTVDNETVILGKGNLSPRPKLRPTTDWRQIGISFGMKENARFCSSQVFDDMITRMGNKTKVATISLNIRGSHRHSLNAQEAKTLAAIPLCQDLDSELKELVGLVPYYEEARPTTPPTSGADMIVNTVLSDEGHGWLVVNNRLTHGEQAIIHTGTKINNGDFLYSSVKDIESRITKQPFALRKKLAGHTVKEVSSGLHRISTCYETIYRNECTYDPQTHEGRCERVPYQVEGREEVRVTINEETYLSEIEFVSEESSRVLGVLTLETKEEDKDYDYGDCETDPIIDRNWH